MARLSACVFRLAVCGLQVAGLAAQSLSNGQFQLSFSPNGLSSLKRVHDVHDTDYIISGRTLGDLVLHYRTAGETVWKDVSSARLLHVAKDGRQATLQVGAALPTLATSARVSSSMPGPRGPADSALSALNDQVEPRNSRDSAVPAFIWWGRHGTREWAQYDFSAPQTLTSAEVYWAESGMGDNPVKLPKAWSLQYREGEQWKDIQPTGGVYGLALDRFDAVTFATVTTTALRLVAQLPEDGTSGLLEWRVNTSHGRQVADVPEIAPVETFQLDGDAMVWTLEVRNRTDRQMEVGDLGLPLPFNTQYSDDTTDTYTKRLIRHAFIGGGGSYIFWMRTNAIGPYLVMVPQKSSGFEYFDQTTGHIFTTYLHSAAAGAAVAAKGGKWRQPHTSVLLAPRGQPGDSRKYSFRFRWAQDYDAVQEILYQEGGFDWKIVPGMTVPIGLPARFSLRTRNRISSIEPEFPAATSVKYLGLKGKDTYLYEARFSRLGENLLKVKYGDGEYFSLEFFVSEPLETLIKKRARFLATREQWNGPKRWYDGVYSQWDMRNRVLRSPDDLDGLQSYAVASDDPALGKAPYLAAKNVFYPDREEVESIEKYIRQFVWGGLQKTSAEPYAYGIYGIPNWKVLRESPKDDQSGHKHIWRIYDYPHVILLYYNMYLVARNNPELVHYLDKDGYLERAYGTAMAFFTIPMEVIKWSAYETGTYNELVIPDLIQALEQSGKHEQAGRLRAHWETKAKYFINQHPYLYGSEYSFDSTGFESTHALAKYAVHRLREGGATAFHREVKLADAQAFLEEQMRLNLACRGREPAYYLLGSDFRGDAGAGYTLSYMAQMGGWAVMDYALNFARDPLPYLRLGYASYLSSWALMNSGTAESNYGYWFPGKENDGGAGGGFEPRALARAWLGNKLVHGSWWYSGEIDLGFSGALRMAATVVTDDPTFGLFAYGGELKRGQGGSIQVVPKDGLRARFYIVRNGARVQIRLDRDGFARDQPVTFDDALRQIGILVENRSGGPHETTLQLDGMPSGVYDVTVDGGRLPALTIRDGESKAVALALGAAPTARVVIRRR